MKHSLLVGTFFLILANSPLPSAAEHSETNQLDTLTLDQALQLAEGLYPELAETRALIEAAEGRVKQAGLFPNPAAVARMESAPFNGRTAGQAEYVGGVSQSVPLGNRLSKAREAEQLERDRRTKQLELLRRDVHKRIRSTFATALYQERAFQTQREIATSSEKSVATTKARVDAGDTVREDLARVEMELARAKVELTRSEALREHAIAELKGAIGDPSLSVKTLAGNLEITLGIPALETLAANLDASPEMSLANAEVRYRQARVDLAKAERIPDVRVDLLYRRLQASEQNAFDVGLSIPLPLFDRNQGRLREAHAEVVAAEARFRSTQNALKLRLHEAHTQLNTALAASRALKADILPRADTVLKSAESRYAVGDISLSEVLPVRRDWAAVQLIYLESLRDVMQAWAQLRVFTNPP